MPASQQHITPDTPLGANLVEGGATFRTWAPTAREVYIALDCPTGMPASDFSKRPEDLLVKDANGFWAGFVPGMRERRPLPLLRRRHRQRRLQARPLRARAGVQRLSRLQLHRARAVGVQMARRRIQTPGLQRPDRLSIPHRRLLRDGDSEGRDIRRHRVCKILDAVDRIEYLADLGVNAVMPLPFQEFQGENSLGYNGTDLFSPEMDYCVPAAELAPYLARVNRLLAKKGHAPLSAADLTGQINQFKAFVDLCHLYGIAVIADVVYNHAGGGFDDQSI